MLKHSVRGSPLRIGHAGGFLSWLPWLLRLFPLTELRGNVVLSSLAGLATVEGT